MPVGAKKIDAPEIAPKDMQEELFCKQLERLNKIINKKERLLTNLNIDLSKCVKNLSLLDDAELLKSNFHLLKKGTASALVFDYYQDPPASRLVELDPKLSPEQNLNQMFNLVKRAKRGLAQIKPRIKEVEDEILGLKNELTSLNEAGPQSINIDDSEEIVRITGKKKRLKRLPYRAFSAEDGTLIWAGRSAKDNDELLKYFTRGNEWWLHAKGTRGSHVIIKSSADSLTLDILLDAATLAAHFSKLKDENLDVSYTRVKYVKKVKGMAPGAVTISQEKTLAVKIDPKRLKRVIATEIKPVP